MGYIQKEKSAPNTLLEEFIFNIKCFFIHNIRNVIEIKISKVGSDQTHHDKT